MVDNNVYTNSCGTTEQDKWEIESNSKTVVVSMVFSKKVVYFVDGGKNYGVCGKKWVHDIHGR